ncbi:hypothetical protein Vretifemale_5763, partial [Volvox reticuliferus]
VPPPGIDAWRKVVFSWGWDFGGLPPSLASSGFVAVYRRYPLTKMSPGSYSLKFMKPENVSLAVIVRVQDANPDVAGTPPPSPPSPPLPPLPSPPNPPPARTNLQSAAEQSGSSTSLRMLQ